MSKIIGLGSSSAPIKFYIANRPQLDEYPTLDELRGITVGEITHIAKNTSNHWRKVFNVYAKFLYDLKLKAGKNALPDTWQQYREEKLFQAHSEEALLFSPPDFKRDKTCVHIIAGKTYAANLSLPSLTWLDNYFAINEEARLVVSPYPDYRQLSNERIAKLIDIIRHTFKFHW